MGSGLSISFRDVTDYLTITESKQSGYIYDKRGKRKHYLPPHTRKEARFRPETDAIVTPSAIDAQIDKFDYVIIFPWAETEPLPTALLDKEFGISNFVDASKKDRRKSITWIDCEDIWHNAVVGTKEEKIEAVKELRALMKERFGVGNIEEAYNGRRGRGRDEDIDEESAHKEVYYHAWLALAREAICERLCSKCGFQMKLTEKSSKSTRKNQREGRVLCRLRAPVSRLEALADEVNYLLQLREEVDPGSKQFWNVEDENGVAIELEEDRTLLSQQQAVDILKELVRLGKISSSELEVNMVRELGPAAWSRRVHVLERVADKIPTYNKFCAYAAFTTQPKLRYLFKEYPSVRGKTLFRYKDRLFLTKLLIEKCFDLEVFMKHNMIFGLPPVIDSFSALHDANRGDEMTIDSLSRIWVSFWRATGREVGVPYVTHIAYEGNQFTYVNILQRPFSQPLNHIRDYFGEKIALLYAWHGMYCYYLVIPCILGLGMEGVYVYRGYVDTIDNIDWPLQIFNFLIVVWASIYIQHWAIEQKAIALKWGTESCVEKQKKRPQLHGATEADVPLDMSFVWNDPVLYFPEETRFWLQVSTSILVFIATLFNCSLIGCVFYLEYLVEDVYTEYEFAYFKYAVAALLAIEITLTSYFFFWFVTYLNDIENHQTNSKYEDALVQKVVAFQMFNYYGACLFTAFGKGYVFDNCTGTCMDDLRILLYAILAVRGAELVLDLLLSMLYRLFFGLFVAAEARYDREQEAESTPLLNGHMSKSNQQSQAAEVALLTEIDKPEFTDRDVFDIYSDVVIQFGYLTFFSVAFPMMAVIVMCEGLLKLRVNAFKLCSLRRRPHIQLAEDIGKWEHLVVAFNILGILSSVGILTFTTEQFTDLDMTEQSLIFLLHELSLILVALFVSWIIPSAPAWISEIRERNRFVVNKWVKGLEDYEVNLKLDADENAESLDDNIDIELLQLSGTLRGMTDEERIKSAYLRAERRRKLLEINEVKAVISNYAKSELFDEMTGIAVDPNMDVALGLLQVRLSTILYNEEIRKLVDKKKKKDSSSDEKAKVVKRESKLAPLTVKPHVSPRDSPRSSPEREHDDKPFDLGVRLKVSVIGHDGSVIGVQYSLPARDNKMGIQSYLLEELLPPFTGIGTRLAIVVFEVVLSPDMGIEHLLLEYKQEHEYAARKYAGLEDFFAELADEFDSASPRAMSVRNLSARFGSPLREDSVSAAGGGFRSPAARAASIKLPAGSTLGSTAEASKSKLMMSNDTDDSHKDEGDEADTEGILNTVGAAFSSIPGIGAVFETEEAKAEREEIADFERKMVEMEAEFARLNSKLTGDYFAKDPECVLLMTSFDLNEPMFNDQIADKTMVLPMFFLGSDSKSDKSDGSTIVRQAGKESKARLNIMVTFQFSKLAMTRNKVALLQKELADIEHEIAVYKVEADKRIKEKAHRDREMIKMEKEKERLQNKG
jgi:hypothetical protein